MAFTAARDDDLVSALMECFGKRSANALSTASDKNGISCEFHNVSNLSG
jgi:hypothetical protein